MLNKEYFSNILTKDSLRTRIFSITFVNKNEKLKLENKKQHRL